MADKGGANGRILKLEAGGRASTAKISRMTAEAVGFKEHIAELDARAVLRDERIVALAREVDQIQAATEHRSVIEQAKGVIMSTMHCSADAAFAVLVVQSQTQNRKMREIAAEIAELQDRRSLG